MKSLLLILLFLSTTIFPQKWNYLKNENVFDGDSKIAFIEAKKEKEKTHPVSITVAITEGMDSPTVFFMNVPNGYCESKWIKIKFDREEELYAFEGIVLSDNTTWYVKQASRKNNLFLSFIDFLIMLKQKSKLHVRFDSDCGNSDYEFSLDGSTDAINYVAKDFINNQKSVENKLAAEYDLIYSGKPFKTTTRYNASVFIFPDASAFYNNIILKRGEEVVVSFSDSNDGYYTLHRAESIDIPVDTALFLGGGSVHLENIQESK